jgi:hypothetical protein
LDRVLPHPFRGRPAVPRIKPGNAMQKTELKNK